MGLHPCPLAGALPPVWDEPEGHPRGDEGVTGSGAEHLHLPFSRVAQPEKEEILLSPLTTDWFRSPINLYHIFISSFPIGPLLLLHHFLLLTHCSLTELGRKVPAPPSSEAKLILLLLVDLQHALRPPEDEG